jgi:hypothetical protein
LSPAANLQPVSLANFPPVSTTPAVVVAKFSAGVVGTGGKCYFQGLMIHEKNLKKKIS